MKVIKNKVLIGVSFALVMTLVLAIGVPQSSELRCENDLCVGLPRVLLLDPGSSQSTILPANYGATLFSEGIELEWQVRDARGRDVVGMTQAYLAQRKLGLKLDTNNARSGSLRLVSDVDSSAEYLFANQHLYVGSDDDGWRPIAMYPAAAASYLAGKTPNHLFELAKVPSGSGFELIITDTAEGLRAAKDAKFVITALVSTAESSSEKKGQNLASYNLDLRSEKLAETTVVLQNANSALNAGCENLSADSSYQEDLAQVLPDDFFETLESLSCSGAQNIERKRSSIARLNEYIEAFADGKNDALQDLLTQESLKLSRSDWSVFFTGLPGSQPDGVLDASGGGGFDFLPSHAVKEDSPVNECVDPFTGTSLNRPFALQSSPTSKLDARWTAWYYESMVMKNVYMADSFAPGSMGVFQGTNDLLPEAKYGAFTSQLPFSNAESYRPTIERADARADNREMQYSLMRPVRVSHRGVSPVLKYKLNSYYFPLGEVFNQGLDSGSRFDRSAARLDPPPPIPLSHYVHTSASGELPNPYYLPGSFGGATEELVDRSIIDFSRPNRNYPKGARFFWRAFGGESTIYLRSPIFSSASEKQDYSGYSDAEKANYRMRRLFANVVGDGTGASGSLKGKAYEEMLALAYATSPKVLPDWCSFRTLNPPQNSGFSNLIEYQGVSHHEFGRRLLSRYKNEVVDEDWRVFMVQSALDVGRAMKCGMPIVAHDGGGPVLSFVLKLIALKSLELESRKGAGFSLSRLLSDVESVNTIYLEAPLSKNFVQTTSTECRDGDGESCLSEFAGQIKFFNFIGAPISQDQFGSPVYNERWNELRLTYDLLEEDSNVEADRFINTVGAVDAVAYVLPQDVAPRVSSTSWKKRECELRSGVRNGMKWDEEKERCVVCYAHEQCAPPEEDNWEDVSCIDARLTRAENVHGAIAGFFLYQGNWPGVSAPPGVDIVLESNENKFVGESCKVDEQCCWSLEAEECSSMRCAGSYPGGYCTRECAGENDSVCGLGGSCARVGSKFFCLRSCSLAGGCVRHFGLSSRL